MNKIKLEILGLTASHTQSGSFALVLGEEMGNRRLPIIIGMFEAQAIAIEMEKIISNRPMTHDLFKSLAVNFDIDVHEIIISDLREGVFFAKIISSFKDGSNYTELDARPSDAVAIALRFDVPIYVYEPVLADAGVAVSDEEDQPKKSTSREKAPVYKKKTESKGGLDPETLEKISTDQLKSMMEAAINEEDYEKAAKIRDELNRRG